jgi:hypothetical protein
MRTQINMLNDLFAGVDVRVGEHTELICEDEEQKIFMDALRHPPKMGY